MFGLDAAYAMTETFMILVALPTISLYNNSCICNYISVAERMK